jgi:hypothetical protein
MVDIEGIQTIVAFHEDKNGQIEIKIRGFLGGNLM